MSYNPKPLSKYEGLNKYKVAVIALVFLLIGIGVGFYFSQNSEESPEVLGINSFYKDFDTLKPSVVEIIDAESLKNTDPNIYSGVENGDKLYVFSDHAIIYRESENKIIKVFPVLPE